MFDPHAPSDDPLLLEGRSEEESAQADPIAEVSAPADP